MEFRPVSGADVNFSSFSLILPSVSVGNVGQLTCDLLINSLRLCKVGYLWTTCVLPVVGSNAFSSENDKTLTLSLEVYADVEKKLAVLQQRSPIVPGKQREFTNQLVEWLNYKGFSEVILLTSCHAYERKDEEILGSQIKYLVRSDEETKRELSDVDLMELKKRKNEHGEETYFMPGAGIARHFHDKCIEHNPCFKSVILMIFCSEGDNIPEAVSLAKALNLWKKYLAAEKEGKMPWSFPISWKCLFGARQPASIF